MGEPGPKQRRRTSASGVLGRRPGDEASATATAAAAAATAAAGVVVAVATAAVAATPAVAPGDSATPSFVDFASSIDAVPRPCSAIPENKAK